jgi:hypothetical protein
VSKHPGQSFFHLLSTTVVHASGGSTSKAMGLLALQRSQVLLWKVTIGEII